jgi:hypothetical protein
MHNQDTVLGGGLTTDTLDSSDGLILDLSSLDLSSCMTMDSSGGNAATAFPTITVSSISPTSSPYLMSTGSISGATWTTQTTTPTLTVDQSGTIDLQGQNADIRVNGESLMETLRGIQDRLNMLRPNTELEAEWDQLRELGEKYRMLESEFKTKSKMWDILKK